MAKEAPKKHYPEAPAGHFRNARGALVPVEFKGPKSYRLTKERYAAGTMHQPGEVITVTDELPSPSWEPVAPGAKSRPAEQMPDASPETEVRPSERSSYEGGEPCPPRRRPRSATWR